MATVTRRLALRLAQKFPLQILPLPLPLSDGRTTLYWHERSHLQPTHRWFRMLLADACKQVSE